MDVVGIIPARYASTRFEGKVLADILGKPMIQWVWENASKARMLDTLIIACDDPIIEELAKGFGANVVMTSVKSIYRFSIKGICFMDSLPVQILSPLLWKLL